MPRRGQISKRDVLPDPMYGSKLVTKLINNIMLDGKKGVAQKIVYDAFAMVEAKMGQDPLEVFSAALENVMPVLEVKARRVGGSNYQVPMEVLCIAQFSLLLVNRYFSKRGRCGHRPLRTNSAPCTIKGRPHPGSVFPLDPSQGLYSCRMDL